MAVGAPLGKESHRGHGKESTKLFVAFLQCLDFTTFWFVICFSCGEYAVDAHFVRTRLDDVTLELTCALCAACVCVVLTALP